MTATHTSISIRWRVLAVTVLVMAGALLASGWVLADLFKQHVMQQFKTGLIQHLDLLTARLELDTNGKPELNTRGMANPRWQQPFSGLYWQVQIQNKQSPHPPEILRSRSLWDEQLRLKNDAIQQGEVHWHSITGPQNQPVLVAERRIEWEALPGYEVRMLVGEELSSVEQARTQFHDVLMLSLGVLYGMLILAAWAQVTIGLYPLRQLQDAVEAVNEGTRSRLHGRFPHEVQSLVTGFNTLLDRNDTLLERARLQAGNLAHALKTPLTILDQVATRAEHPGFENWTTLVREQVDISRKHIDWHLKRSRMAAQAGRPGNNTPLLALAQGVIRVLERVYAEKNLQFELPPSEFDVHLAMESQDGQEIIGNLLDNACKWAKSSVKIQWSLESGENSQSLLRIDIEDDGPGIDPHSQKRALERGQRLDETTPGSGLGLAIVNDLLQFYGGSLQLGAGKKGGLHVTVRIPVAGQPYRQAIV